MMWLLGALGAVRKALAALWALAVRYPLAAALVVALLACGLLWRSGEHARNQRDGARAVVAEYKEAQAKAVAWALAEKRAKETAANDIKDNANDRRKDAQTAGAGAGADYRLSNQCVRVTPAKGGGQHTDLPRPDSVAGQLAPAPGIALVAVTPGDFDKCTSAALDLDNAYAWGQDMVAAGLAK